MNLNYGKVEKIIIKQKISIPDELLVNTDIVDIKELNIDGTFDRDNHLYLEVSGIMVIPESRTLENVEYPFDFIIDEKISEDSIYLQKRANYLDIISILWENIVLEIPMRLVKDENEPINLKGEGWELTENNNIDKRLAALTELLEDGKE